MGTGDKISNKAEELAGQAKEAAGDVTGDADLEAEGKAEQLIAKAKQAGEHLKDAAGDLVGGVKDALHALLLRRLPRLTDDGVARLVVGRNLGADSLQRWLADAGWEVERTASAKGFRVFDITPTGEQGSGY